MMNAKKEIIKKIEKISGKYSKYEVFADWVKCASLALSNSCDMVHDAVWRKREDTYIGTMNKYDKAERKMLTEMFVLLAEALDNRIEDVLGQVYMESNMGSKAAGQFFTPYHVSELCARLSIPIQDQNGTYHICEPSCGGGGMVIAIASALKDEDINYQTAMDVIAQDLDWNGVYMCYLQLSLLGIKATCIQGDTLSKTSKDEYRNERVLYTPARKRVVL